MGYSNPNETAIYTLPASTELVGSTIADAQYYTSNVYAQSLTVEKKCKVTDVTVESGGTMTKASMQVASSGTFTRITIGNSGEVRFGNYNDANYFVVYAGGSLYTGQNVKLYNADIKAGAIWQKTTLAQIGGSETNIEQGVIIANNNLGDNFFVKDGVVSNLNLTSETSNYAGCFYAIDIDGGIVNRGATMRLSLGVVASGGMTIKNGATVAVYDDTNETGSGAIISDATVEEGGSLQLGKLTYGNNLKVQAGGIFTYSDGAVVGGAETNIAQGTVVGNVFGADFFVSKGVAGNMSVTSARNATIYDGLKASGGSVYDGGSMTLQSGGSVENFTVSGAEALLVVGENAGGSGLTVLSGGSVRVSSAIVYNISIDADNTNALNLYDGATVSGGTFNGKASVIGVRIHEGARFDNARLLRGSVYVTNSGAMTNAVVSGGVIIARGSEAVVSGAEVFTGGTLAIQNGAYAAKLTMRGGTLALRDFPSSMSMGNSPVVENVTICDGEINLSSGATLRTLNASGGSINASNGAVLSGATVNAGAVMNISTGAALEDTTLKAGATLTLEDGAATGEHLALDLTGVSSNTTALVNDLTYLSAETSVAVELSEWGVANSYKLATTGDTGLSVTVTDGAATATLANTESITNPFAGASYTWDGTSLTGAAYSFSATAAAAGALTATAEADNVNGGDLAVKWTDATTVVTGNVYLAGTMTAGAAWLELDGYIGSIGSSGTTLYGAQGSTFADGTVNIDAKSGSLRNLAAGANAGGTVKAVNLTFTGAKLDGTGYAGGFGNVTGKTATKVSTGTFTKDFYAGALANKLSAATSVGEVAMTITNGTFSGNIYGASAVKTDTTKGNGTRHTAGDVTLTVTGGSTTKGAQACIFAGGYATGDATGTVYTVQSVTATISGGSWGEAAGGRGVFGGIMASGVAAQVLGTVNITVSGDATMGNVYGGGWAQKTGAKSIVGDVNINIAGGTVANVFGGGSHSTSGGTTETGDVTITVSGGNITGAIYARGQLDGDTTGAASVIFTGATNFSCDVFGYSYVGGAASDAGLSFTTYTGEFSGDIGGFDGITLAGATAMTLSTAAADVANGKWEFDLTDRTNTLAGTSLLTWSTANFENDTIKVTFSDDTQAQGGWNIATVAEAFSGTNFDLEIGGTEIATGLASNNVIGGEGVHADWGFALESGVLKFKQLA